MNRMWSAQEIQDKIEWEGFDYFFTGYIGPSSIKNEELRELAEQYLDARNELRTKLRELANAPDS